MTPDQFFTAICDFFGWPVTPWRLAVMNYWAQHEGMDFERTWNPWATTMPGDLDLTYDNGYGPGNWNWVPVRVYRTPEAGVEATIRTLQSDYYYTNVRRCFRDQVGYQEAVKPRDFLSWVGSESYGQNLVNFMNNCQESKEEEMNAEEKEKLEKGAAAYKVLSGTNQGLVEWWNNNDYSMVEGYLGSNPVDSTESPGSMGDRVNKLEQALRDAGITIPD